MKSHGQRSLAGYSPWGHKESDMTWQLSATPRLRSVVLTASVDPVWYSQVIAFFVCLFFA